MVRLRPDAVSLLVKPVVVYQSAEFLGYLEDIMTGNSKPSILVTGDELKSVKKMEKLSPLKTVPPPFPPAGDGFSYCENGLCYVACGNTWYMLVDENDRQYNCGSGNGLYFQCGTSTFRCTC